MWEVHLIKGVYINYGQNAHSDALIALLSG